MKTFDASVGNAVIKDGVKLIEKPHVLAALVQNEDFALHGANGIETGKAGDFILTDTRTFHSVVLKKDDVKFYESAE